MDTFNHLGVLLELSKLEGLATCLTFMEIEVDTTTLQIRLPSDKLLHLKEELAAVVSKRCLSKHALQSLTGLLQHATKVVWPGRPQTRQSSTLLPPNNSSYLKEIKIDMDKR